MGFIVLQARRFSSIVKRGSTQVSVSVVTPASSNRRFLAPGDKLGKHEVIRQIAVGGMAELYLTRTVGLEGFEKLVVLKRILPQFVGNPSFVNMFLNEARLAATLHHPNIAQVYDIGQEDGEYFFSMEYVHGEDLGRLGATARENGVPISLDCVLTLGAGLCAGLHHAHERTSPEGKPLGVVHRDVSPTNVLVSYDGAVKLVDFGIARLAGEPASQTGLKGKISYMSPEQCRGKVPLDRRSDVFSIGTILYELTTGRLPFVDETEYGVLQQIVTRDVEPPSRLVPGYPAALEGIVMRALARDPARRFSTALELQNQLEDFAHDNRLRVSPLVVARLMSTLFPARLEDWDHARAQGAFFVEQHVVRTLIESGKTPEAPHYMPEPLPPVDDGSGGVTTVSSPPAPGDVEPLERTEVGPKPRLSPHPAPRMPPAMPAMPPMPPPPPMATPLAALSPAKTVPTPPPRRLPTPPPMPPAPPVRASPRPAPVPNMPGAVPIVMPLPAPPIPSGGTLVSSATQAGKQPPAVPAQAPYGSGNLGSPIGVGPIGAAPIGPAGIGHAAPAPSYTGHPSPAGSGGYGLDGYAGQVGPALSSGPISGAHGVAAGLDQGAYAGMPADIAHAQDVDPGVVGDITEQVRHGAARPTLMVRVPRRSRMPILLGVVAAAGAAVGVWLAIGAELVSETNRATVRESARPAEIAPAGETREGDEVPTAAAPAGSPTESEAAASAEPAGPASNDSASAPQQPSSANSESTAASQEPTASADDPGGDASELETTKKRPVKAGLQDARTKGKPRARSEGKRADAKRGQKPDAKEQTWNDNSPFLPVTTPKR
jgi:serine/threonine protein kinase